MSNFFLHLVSESNITSYGCSFIRFKVSSVSDYFKSSPKHLTLQYNRLILAGLGRGLGAGFGFAVWFSAIMGCWICSVLVTFLAFFDNFFLAF